MPLGASDRIVIVDDVPLMADLISAHLAQAGFRNIVLYTDSRKALQAIRQNTRPAVVITDFNMPHLTGLRLLVELERHHPELDAIIVTGNRADAMREPHRFLVIEKGPNMYEELVENTLLIMRSHLAVLLQACPSPSAATACPLCRAASLSASQRVAWLAGLRPAEIHEIIHAHGQCPGR